MSTDVDNSAVSGGVERVGVDRLAEAEDGEVKPRLPFVVVGIGASAGGLESVARFLDAMPSDSGMAFVLVQHLPPDRESMMPEILGRHTKMKCVEVEDGVEVEGNVMYVIRPGRTLTIAEGKLRLGEPVEKRGHRKPVDDFFTSLAAEQRERAICVVMSGMGTNGTLGAEQVKAVGGVCIAQDPASAKFSGMPKSLIDSGLADLVLRPEEMPEALMRYASHPYAKGEEVVSVEQGDRVVLKEMMSYLRMRTRHDFSGYKKPTVVRRIQRRMGLHHVTALSEYARVLRQNPTEATELADDLQIHVTGFFRDAEAWEALRQEVIVPLVGREESESSIRAWVTACATGEEAYTLAMLLLEAAEDARKRFDIKVFATDTADRSLGHARVGLYPGGIESEVTPARLDRFFDKEDSSYRIKKEVRELVVFAPQNVMQDPPFSKLHICTCRNLLIYLEPEVQERVLRLLHFGLREGGVLFLGTSETVGPASGLFETIDKKWRIFRKDGAGKGGAVEFPKLLRVPAGEKSELTPQRVSLAHMVQRELMERYAPPTVVVDREHRIVHFYGDTGRYLAQPGGEPTRDVLSMAREKIRGAVRAALQGAMAKNASVTARDGLEERDGVLRRIFVRASPQGGEGGAEYFLVSFEEQPEEAAAVAGKEDKFSSQVEMEEELRRVRAELQSNVEELQTSNEELKASNEEITSINEELQSTNEELETSKEELQSLNEELTTVNAQLQSKMEELEGTTNDLSSLLTSTDIAVVFLDQGFCIRRFTPAVRDLLELIPSDVGRPLSDLARKFNDPELVEDARRVLEKLTPLGKEIVSSSGKWYMRRALPYRTMDNRIAGVVLTFVDITERKRAEEELREALVRAQAVLEQMPAGVVIAEPSGKITFSNRASEMICGALGHRPRTIDDYLLWNPRRMNGRAYGREETPMARALRKGETVVGEEMLFACGDDVERAVMVNAAPIRDDLGKVAMAVIAIADMTKRREAEEVLEGAKKKAEEAKGAAEAANEAKDQFLAIISHELRTPLSAILLWSKMINRGTLPEEQMGEAMEAIEQSAQSQQRLIDDLLDSTRISSGKLRLNLVETELEGALRAAVEAVRPAANAKVLDLVVELSEEIGVVRADADRVQQIVWNLLTNGVKFTPLGGRVEIRSVREGNEVRVEVKDSGMGISAEFLPKLFLRFSQADNSNSRTSAGLGLGLAITKQLVELHGGTITATSEGLGKGATFTVRLPLPRTRKGDGGVAAGKRAKLRGKGKGVEERLAGVRLLLVEDEPQTRRALGTLLKQAGMEVKAVSTAGEALGAFEEGEWDLVLSDISMPEMDGYELMRRLREREGGGEGKGVPAVALTAFTREEDRKRAEESGFQAHVSKPVDPDQLLKVLSMLVAG